MEASKDMTSSWLSTRVWKGLLVMVKIVKRMRRTKTIRA